VLESQAVNSANLHNPVYNPTRQKEMPGAYGTP
jgi:hypothetical protein